MRYARRSASEVQSQLYVAWDQLYISKDDFRRLYDQATETKKLINGFIRYLRQPSQGAVREPAPDYQIE